MLASGNFKLVASTYFITRENLIVELNTDPRIPPEVIKPTSKVTNKSNYMTTGNEKSPNKNITTNKNSTKEPTNQEIEDALRANSCTSIEFDEETGLFVYNQDGSKESFRHEKIQSKLELVLLCISISAVILAFILLTTLRLKTSEKLFIHKNLLLSLGLGNLVYVLDKSLFASRRDHVVMCSVVTVCQFLFYTALFTWMLVEGINLYIKLVKVFPVKRQYVAYLAIGWGIPVIIVGLIAAIRPNTFDMGKAQYKDITCGSLHFTAEIQRVRCWINGSLWIYKGPILVILVANMVLFAILLRVIFGKIAAKNSNDHLKITKKSLKSIFALLPLLGVTYVVGFFIEFHLALEYVYILLTSTQGVVFFIFHCVLDDQVQDATRKLFVKCRADSKTRTTPASNPNTKPVVERNSCMILVCFRRQEEGE
ncbi:adhesion G-protein coupled receptor D1-like isoform X1 [Orbicella faveolata]|uniref:adhesion G-protein coupled receptor D1-like isoform X1 n=1 Tax=Orbicella faveolata TaxID=48498 RepID=UPI0009E334C2|nr:adhesion G-protein coupled receptor D1-like isoform X1 [Orbicella faveolata]